MIQLSVSCLAVDIASDVAWRISPLSVVQVIRLRNENFLLCGENTPCPSITIVLEGQDLPSINIGIHFLNYLIFVHLI